MFDRVVCLVFIWVFKLDEFLWVGGRVEENCGGVVGNVWDVVVGVVMVGDVLVVVVIIVIIGVDVLGIVVIILVVLVVRY